jgi:PTS system galactitol-specific IIA component
MTDELRKLFSPEHIKIVDREITQNDLFSKVAEELTRDGYTKDSYFIQLVEREVQYPTGLKLSGCNVAIPHVNNEFINKSLIYLTVLKYPIKWHCMDNPEEVIDVNIVFNICLAEKEKQVEILSSIIELIQHEELLGKIQKCTEPDQALELIRKEE